MLILKRMTHVMSEAQIISLWSEGTDAEIVNILKDHYAGAIDLREYWSVGDERTVNLSAMSATGVEETHEAQTVKLVISNVGGKYFTDGETECLFQIDQKVPLLENGKMNSTNDNTGGWRDCIRRPWCNNVYYNAIPETLRPIFKQFINQSGIGGNNNTGTYDTTDYFALRSEVEVFGNNLHSFPNEGSRVEYYETSSNINDYNFVFRSPSRADVGNAGKLFCLCSDSGISGRQNMTAASDRRPLKPFGVI